MSTDDRPEDRADDRPDDGPDDWADERADEWPDWADHRRIGRPDYWAQGWVVDRPDDWATREPPEPAPHPGFDEDDVPDEPDEPWPDAPPAGRSMLPFYELVPAAEEVDIAEERLEEEIRAVGRAIAQLDTDRACPLAASAAGPLADDAEDSDDEGAQPLTTGQVVGLLEHVLGAEVVAPDESPDESADESAGEPPGDEDPGSTGA